jgi:hypothetical protein
MKASTADELITGVPRSRLLKVTGKPRLEDLKIIRRYLNTNAMIFSCYKVGGLHGHLDIITTNDEYFTVATYVPPLSQVPWLQL